MENSETRKKSSSARRKYKYQLLMVGLVTLLAVLIDKMFGRYFLTNSINLTTLLQRIPAKLISYFFSVFVFGGLFLTTFVLFLIQKDVERNLVMLIGVFTLIYCQAFLKLLFADGRPIFFTTELPSDMCICDYGKPSGHAMCSAGLLLIIYSNLNENYSISKGLRVFLKVLFGFIFLMICLSRIYRAVHSYNQVILGGLFGLIIFLIFGNYEDSIIKSLILPLLDKSRYKERKPLYDLFGIMIVTNYALLYLWSFQRNYFEHLDNIFYDFLNCFHCLFGGRAQFSNKIISDALNFNTVFGFLFGAYLFPYKGIYWVGFGTDGKIKHTFARIGLLIVFVIPLVLSALIRTDFVFFEIVKNISCSILTGFLISNTLAKFSIWLTVNDDSGAAPLLPASEVLQQ